MNNENEKPIYVVMLPGGRYVTPREEQTDDPATWLTRSARKARRCSLNRAVKVGREYATRMNRLYFQVCRLKLFGLVADPVSLYHF